MADKPEDGNAAKPKAENAGDLPKADPPPAPETPSAATTNQQIAIPAGMVQGQIPPIPPGAMPQLAGAMLGITVGQPQQNPIVVQHICNYLSHDSDNRLKWFEERGKKSHIFRMTALVVVALLAIIVLAIPLVALARGDMSFVKEFLDRYLTQIILVALALLGGGKLFDLLK